MNLIQFNRLEINGRLNYEFYTKDSDFRILTHYLRSEGTIWGYLIDPSVKNDTYGCNNYYYTKRDALYFYIAEDHYLDQDDPNVEYLPVIILLNTLYGILVAFRYIHIHKIQQFSLTLEGRRYIFSAQGMEPIIVDPDLGNLYNDTIPRIIARRINDHFEYDIRSDNDEDKGYVFGNPTDEHLTLFCKILIKNYAQDLFIRLYEWPNECLNVDREKQRVKYDSIVISNSANQVKIRPIKQKGPRDQICLSVTKDSLRKFLQAWDTRLQFADSFTVVFLGQTLRFFEGEPL